MKAAPLRQPRGRRHRRGIGAAVAVLLTGVGLLIIRPSSIAAPQSTLLGLPPFKPIFNSLQEALAPRSTTAAKSSEVGTTNQDTPAAGATFGRPAFGADESPSGSNALPPGHAQIVAVRPGVTPGPAPADSAVLAPAGATSQALVANDPRVPVPPPPAFLAGMKSQELPAAPRATVAPPPPSPVPVDSGVLQTRCSTCGNTGGLVGEQGPPSGGAPCNCGSGDCVPGHKPGYACEAHTYAGRFLCGLYECIGCPDPCYDPKWLPIADSAFFVESVRPQTQQRVRWDSGFNLEFPDRAEFFWARADGHGKGPNPIADFFRKPGSTTVPGGIPGAGSLPSSVPGTQGERTI